MSSLFVELLLFILERESYINFLFLQRERKGERGRERERERDEREIDLLFQLFIHSFIVSCTCPDRSLNHKLGRLEQCSHQLLYPARVSWKFLNVTSQDYGNGYCLLHIQISLNCSLLVCKKSHPTGNFSRPLIISTPLLPLWFLASLI